jgi:prefoldin subunit 5
MRETLEKVTRALDVCNEEMVRFVEFIEEQTMEYEFAKDGVTDAMEELSQAFEQYNKELAEINATKVSK